MAKHLNTHSPNLMNILPDSTKVHLTGTAQLPQPTMRDTLLADASDEALREAINQLYRSGAIVGDGGTSDAIRNERLTGLPTMGSYHTKKGEYIIRFLKKFLKRRDTNLKDRAIAWWALDDLLDALGRVQ